MRCGCTGIILVHGHLRLRRMGMRREHGAQRWTMCARQYMSHLAVRDRVSRSTQNQAFNAVRCSVRRRIPVVLTTPEVERIYTHVAKKNVLGVRSPLDS